MIPAVRHKLGHLNSYKFLARFLERVKFYQAVAPIISNSKHCFGGFFNSVEGTACFLQSIEISLLFSFFDRFSSLGINTKFDFLLDVITSSRWPGLGKISRRCLIKDDKEPTTSSGELTLISLTLMASSIVSLPHIAGIRNAIRLASLISEVPCCFAVLHGDSIMSELISILSEV